MKDRCVVVAGGDCDLSLLSEISTSDFVIAADSGLNHLMSANVKPDLIVGDFDSYSGRLPEGIETVVLPTKKDDTDLLFSLRCGVERGFKKYCRINGSIFSFQVCPGRFSCFSLYCNFSVYNHCKLM